MTNSGQDQGGRWNGQSQGGGRRIVTPGDDVTCWVGDDDGFRMQINTLTGITKGNGQDDDAGG